MAGGHEVCIRCGEDSPPAATVPPAGGFFAELMGHTSLEMVSRVYLHLADQRSHLSEAVEKATRVRTTASSGLN